MASSLEEGDLEERVFEEGIPGNGTPDRFLAGRDAVRALARFVPPVVLRRLAAGPLAGPMAEEFPAALMFADIAGFTTLAERLARKLGVAALAEPVRALIFDKAEGHPFFSEELALALRDAGLLTLSNGECRLAPGTEALASQALPDTVQGVITRRIDGLEPREQMALKVASVIGRVFAARTVAGIHPIAPDRPFVETSMERLRKLDLTPLDMAGRRGRGHSGVGAVEPPWRPALLGGDLGPAGHAADPAPRRSGRRGEGLRRNPGIGPSRRQRAGRILGAPGAGGDRPPARTGGVRPQPPARRRRRRAAAALVPHHIGRTEEFRLHALSAPTSRRLGQREEASHHLDKAFVLMATGAPTAYYALEAYGAAAEVGLDVHAGAPAQARTAVTALARFARIFPIARPRALLWRGALLERKGRRGRTVRRNDPGSQGFRRGGGASLPNRGRGRLYDQAPMRTPHCRAVAAITISFRGAKPIGRALRARSKRGDRRCSFVSVSRTWRP